MTELVCGQRKLDLKQPALMGVLNVTPDSFSDGGRFLAEQAAVEQAHAMVEAGASIIDIGGESTRPGADPVTESEETDRVLPVLEALHGRVDAVLSVDTIKPAVMRSACSSGAGLINDVRALQEPGALEVAAQTDAAVCLMHMQGQPRTMQHNPVYEDVAKDVTDFLDERVQAAQAAGIDMTRLLIDPGFGFGKTLTHNLALLKSLSVLASVGPPVLIGMSRKSMFSKLLGDMSPIERVPASVAAATIAVLNGARIVRTHDVAQTRQGVALAQALVDT